MRRSLVVLLVALATGAVLAAVPAQAVDRAQVAAMKEEARAAMAEMQAAVPATKAGKAVLVRCDKGESVQAALDKNPGPVTIEIQGICAENVRIEHRGDVTIRGRSGDPALDGLQGVAEPPLGAALEIRYAPRIGLENLSFNNGPAAGVMLRYSSATITNCTMNDNAGGGLVTLYASLLSVYGMEASGNGSTGIVVDNGSFVRLVDEEVVVSGNGSKGISVARGSWVYAERALVSGNVSDGITLDYAGTLWCWECDVVNNANAPAKGVAQVVATRGSFTSLWQSFVSGRNGLNAVEWAYADVDCMAGEPSEHPCGLAATRNAASVSLGGGAWFALCDVEGRLTANGGEIGLCGARQVGMQLGSRNEFQMDSLFETSGCWRADGSEYLESSLLETVFGDFSHAIFSEGTNISSPVQCVDAADALNKGAVIEAGGSVTGCAHWAQ